MTIYTVFVKDGLGRRFIDTSWAREDAAERRVKQLRRSMDSTLFGGQAWSTQMEVEDLQIASVTSTSSADQEQGPRGPEPSTTTSMSLEESDQEFKEARG